MEQPTSTASVLLSSSSSHKSRLASRSGGLLEVVRGDQSIPESDGLFVQFIHQTVKEYVQFASKTLGLSPISPNILQENGYNFILRTCSSCDEWVSCIKEDVFKYARCAVMKCKEDYRAHDSECSRLLSVIARHVMNSMNSIISMNSRLDLIDLRRFLAKQVGTFFTGLLKEDPDIYKRYAKGHKMHCERQLARLAVAMNFPEYFVHYPGIIKVVMISRGLLHVAVAAPHLGTGIRDADHEYMIRVLVGIGCDVNERDGWMLKHINTNQVIDESKGVSPLVQTLIDRDGSEEVRLRIAKTLLDLGASADMDNSVVLDGGVRTHFNPLQYCVCYESAAFVRLLLQYRTYPTKYDADFLRLARIRQDADLIQTLLDFGIRDGDGKDVSSDSMPVEAAIIMQSHVAAAPSGGLSTALFRHPHIERLRQDTENHSRGVANKSSSTNFIVTDDGIL